MAFKHYGFWQCMDTMRDKKILNKLLKEKKAPWLNQKKNRNFNCWWNRFPGLSFN